MQPRAKPFKMYQNLPHVAKIAKIALDQEKLPGEGGAWTSMSCRRRASSSTCSKGTWTCTCAAASCKKHQKTQPGPRFQIWSFAITLFMTCDFVCSFTTSPFSGRLSVYHVVNGQTDFAGRDFVCPFARCPFARLPRLHFPPAFAPDKKVFEYRVVLEL